MKIAVAGLAFGGQVHVPGWKLVSGCEVVAVCSGHLEKAQAYAEKNGIPIAVASVSELIALKPDIISLALPPIPGEAAAREALKAGIPVLTEKPLATTAAKALELEQYAKKLKVPHAIDFQFMELPAFVKTMELLPQIGKLTKIEHDWQLESYAIKNKLWSWKTDASKDGGVLGVLGSHFLYLLNRFAGLNYSEFEGQASNEKVKSWSPEPHLAAEDRIELKFSGSGLPPVHAVISNSNPEGKGHRWTFTGEKGSLTLHNPTKDYMAGFFIELNCKRVFEDIPAAGIDGRLAPFVSLAQRFAAHVKSPRDDFSPSFSDGARVQEWMEKIRERF